MRVLVTGGAGYIGSKVVPLLLNNGHDVVVYDELRYGGDPLLNWIPHPKFSFVKGDVRNYEQLAKVIKGVDAIIHLAALVGYPICDRYPSEAKSINLDVSLALNDLREGKPLMFSSTDSNYGTSTGQTCTEDVPLQPTSLYGRTKTESETAFLAKGNAIVYRFASAFGISSRMRLDNLIHDFCFQAKTRKSLLLYEAGFKRSFVHVSDMARAFVYGLENFDAMKNEAYNIAHPEISLTKLDLAKLIEKKVKFYLHLADFAKDKEQRNFTLSSEKVQRKGFEFKVGLEEGIDEVLKGIDVLEIRSHYYP